ncbi:UNVERIFIED_CONTAM: Carbon catabolite repressor protein 46 [Sesamum radiatum]|uniref:Carbon catabolite repressor protein 46 n=1 Tax=Sesamum radiatum TaxID=300843 RepID=A0AAW2MHF2_SESRA
MNRRPPSFRSLAVAATADAAISDAGMSYRPYFRGVRPHGRRSYSERPFRPASGEFVSGDSHFRAVQDANRGFRPSYNAVPPPPQYVTGQQLYGPGSQSYRPASPVSQQPPGPRPYGHPRQVGPAFERFTVLSYNILADYLATDHWEKLYFHIPRYIMDWNWRKKNITFELGLWSADILCFQEVDRFQDIEAELKQRGYNGIWKVTWNILSCFDVIYEIWFSEVKRNKGNEVLYSNSRDMRTGDPADGCAIFWRASRFKLLHEESIEYNKLGLRDNVAQICVFEIRVLLDRAHAVSKLWDDAPVVICGDFNCTPKNSSGLRDSSGEPLVTSYHRRFSGTVDYIWHSEGLQTAKVLAPIPKHVMHQTRGFPTKKWGSDHIALVSEFAFAKDVSISSEKPSQ